MSRRLQHAVRRWLDAEGAADGAAERRLRQVFRTLPQPSLSAGFTERVMVGAGLVAPRRAAVAPVWRAAAALALILAGAAATTAPRILLGLAGWVTPGDLLRLAAGALIETCQRLGEGLALWQAAASIGETFAEAFFGPPLLAVMTAATLLSAGGLRMLHGLLAVDGRRDDVRA